MSSAFFILKGEKPNCTSTDCRKSTTETWVWQNCATTTSRWTSWRKDSMRVVLPEPISPVITTKPSVNQIVDSMYALARACCLLRYRNCGSGLRRNGNSRSLNSSRYMATILWDVYLRGQFGEQPARPALTAPRILFYHCQVPELAARTGLFRIVMQVHARMAQERRALRKGADQVDHGAVAARAGFAQRQPHDGAQVIFKLAGDGALDGPVPRIVHPGRHFVGDQPATADKKFDGQNADVAQMLHHGQHVPAGQAVQPCVTVRCAREPQDAGGVQVVIERIHPTLAIAAAYADDGYLQLKGHQLLICLLY